MLDYDAECDLYANRVRRRPAQSQLRPTRSHATSLGSHSVLIFENRRSTFGEVQDGQGGAGLSEVDRYSSNRSPHASQRYS